ncbi:hypothetical protein CWC46_15080 [Prodigiosinella confusarubida]|uniref:Uncharacterized protein n=1 Tax=Serratia sp. (strain ATCC 39006) TaxID=104623 RepID=A0A2I5TLB5_SERS3|nr:hypothetical protein [Serratia sp. ATCC 39006]AUH01021.1 hypothetical protein CWC46_15080 [Serratia sp. ATCC 39006]AUH05342.1 hypothetical protein Ser39006_015085 [Serratia sp. ATCC 39006]
MSYKFTELPPEGLAEAFPCTALMHWPEYDTKVIDTKVNGRDVVIQLWKGFCPSYMPGLVGGFGAEVGIYYKSWQPKMWWPDHQHKKEISFTLINPVTNEVFFTAGPEHAWWLHKWMTVESYMEYKKNTKIPTSPTEYILKYVIDGKESVW